MTPFLLAHWPHLIAIWIGVAVVLSIRLGYELRTGLRTAGADRELTAAVWLWPILLTAGAIWCLLVALRWLLTRPLWIGERIKGDLSRRSFLAALRGAAPGSAGTALDLAATCTDQRGRGTVRSGRRGRS